MAKVAVLGVVGFALVTTAWGQRGSKEITYLTRPITRTQVEALFDRTRPDERGVPIFSAVPHAPREVAVVVWPAKDEDLIKLLPVHKGWVVTEAVLRATPGVVPTLERAIRLGVGAGGMHKAFGPFASREGKLIDTLGGIPGAESSHVLHNLVGMSDAKVRVATLHVLSVRKRALPERKQAVKRAIAQEITRNYQTASALGPGYLMLASEAESKRLMKLVYEQAVKAEGAVRAKPPADFRERHLAGNLRELRVHASLWLVSVGDRSQLPQVRSVLKGDKEGFLAVEAVQVLAERVGPSERLTLESALTAPSSRTREMAAMYLGQLGDKRSIPALRNASKVKAPDASSGWRDYPQRLMLEVADAIESGQRYVPKFRTGTPVPWWRI